MVHALEELELIFNHMKFADILHSKQQFVWVKLT
jgi:hypothetical protein